MEPPLVMVQLAALVSSLIGRWVHFDPPRLSLLVACGAAGGDHVGI